MSKYNIEFTSVIIQIAKVWLYVLPLERGGRLNFKDNSNTCTKDYAELNRFHKLKLLSVHAR